MACRSYGAADERPHLRGLTGVRDAPDNAPARIASAESGRASMAPSNSHDGGESPNTDVRINGAALIVEDNIIIAMDVQSGLAALGADPVHLAIDMAKANQILDDHEITVVVLDVNLGRETSIPLADRLESEGIPFVFSTGYGEGEPVLKRFTNAAILSKPFNHASLRDAIARVLGQGRN